PALLFGTTSLLVPLHLARLGAGAVALSGVFLAAVSLEACVSPLVGRIADRRGRLRPLSIGRSRPRRSAIRPTRGDTHASSETAARKTPLRATAPAPRR